jgi:hypothetical protein
MYEKCFKKGINADQCLYRQESMCVYVYIYVGKDGWMDAPIYIRIFVCIMHAYWWRYVCACVGICTVF